MARTSPAFYSLMIKRPCLTRLCSTDADQQHTSTSTGVLCVFIACTAFALRELASPLVHRSADEIREGMQRALAKHEHGVEL